MSYNLVTKSLTVSNSLTEVYKCGGDNAIVIGLSLTNNLVSDITVNVTLYSDSGGTTTDIIAPNTIIEPGETIIPIGGVQKMVLATNDKIQAQCGTNVGLDVICSAMELNDYSL